MKYKTVYIIKNKYGEKIDNYEIEDILINTDKNNIVYFGEYSDFATPHVVRYVTDIILKEQNVFRREIELECV